MTPAQLDTLVSAGTPAALADLSRLCAIPSVSAKNQSLPECAHLVAELMRAERLDARLLDTPGGPQVVYGEARCRNRSAPTVLFYNHYDVQPPEPLDLWKSDPFALTILDGVAYARGVTDDKGHIISRLLALRALRGACGGEYPFHIKMLVEGEEEVGSPHLGGFVEANADLLAADFCIWEEGGVSESGRPALYCGMRGIAYFELTVRTIAYDAHSGVGGSVLPNAAWRLTWALASLKDANERILIAGHYDKARPASNRDLDLLNSLPGDEAYLRTQFELDASGALGGEATTGLEFKRRQLFEPTLTICGIQSGWNGPGAKTVLPAAASAKVDFRLVPDQDPDELVTALRKHLDDRGFSDVEIRYLGGQRPARVDPDHPLVRLAVEAARDVYNMPADVVPMIGVSGPMWWFAGRLGIPVTSPGVGYPGMRAHAPNENMRLDDFHKGTLHLANLLARIDSAR